MMPFLRRQLIFSLKKVISRPCEHFVLAGDNQEQPLCKWKAYKNSCAFYTCDFQNIFQNIIVIFYWER